MSPVKKWMIGIICAVIALSVFGLTALALILGSLGLFEEIEETEMLRSRNVSRQLEYVLVERNGGGATVPINYSLRVRRADSEERGAEVCRVYGVDPENMVIMWRGNDLSIGLRGNVTFVIRNSAVTVAGQEVKVHYDSL